jgi:hypothetical protein
LRRDFAIAMNVDFLQMKHVTIISALVFSPFFSFANQFSKEKEIFSVVIHYLDGTIHTSVMQDCTSFFEFSVAKDTIILDMELYPTIELLVRDLKNEEVIATDAYYCDIRLTAIIFYSDRTFDLVCISGENYKRACVIYNGKEIAPQPELTLLFYNLIYDKDEPLNRRLLFGIKDE